MAIGSSPVVGSFVEVTETGTAGATTAIAPIDPVKLGSRAGIALVATTGAPLAINVQQSAQLSLLASTPQTIDLTSWVGLIGTKTFGKVHGYRVSHLGVADATGSVTMKSGASTGFVGGDFTTAGTTLSPNSEAFRTNLNTAGWTVDSTHKLITFDPGTTAQTIVVFFWGE